MVTKERKMWRAQGQGQPLYLATFALSQYPPFHGISNVNNAIDLSWPHLPKNSIVVVHEPVAISRAGGQPTRS